MSVSMDVIERQIFLKAPRSRVWQAITTVEEFEQWFGMKFDSRSFEPGKTIRGQITIKGYEHVSLEMVVDRVEPESLFSYRWHPYAVDMKYDYSVEPMTLVTFELTDAEGGTQLKVTESGFEALPPERVAEAFRMNSGGWEGQLKNIDKYVSEG